jgi:hypothetical protein
MSAQTCNSLSANLLLVELLFATTLLHGPDILGIALPPPLRLAVRIDIREWFLGVANLCHSRTDAEKLQRASDMGANTYKHASIREGTE